MPVTMAAPIGGKTSGDPPVSQHTKQNSSEPPHSENKTVPTLK